MPDTYPRLTTQSHTIRLLVCIGATIYVLLTCTLDSSHALELCPDRYPATISPEFLELPFCSSHPIDTPNDAIERVIVTIHGRGSNALGSLETMQIALTSVAGETDRTFILAPQFLDDGNHLDVPIDGNDLYWTSGVANWGGLSTTDYSARVSSFEILDRMLFDMADLALFPNLVEIVILGHSAGGQFVNRYAASSDLEDIVAADGIAVRYIVANPSSYVYFNGERVVDGTDDVFEVPDSTSCPRYNEYGFGLEELFNYHRTRGITPEIMREQYPRRDIVYLLGENDNDPNHPSLSLSCQSMMQGNHRLERAMIYVNYLQHFFGPSILLTQSLVIVPGVGHSSRGMFTSDTAIELLFADGAIGEGAGEGMGEGAGEGVGEGAGESFTLTVVSTPTDGGTAILDPPDGPYPRNSLVTLTAIPAAGFRFERWSGSISSFSSVVTITMTEDMSITALFVENVVIEGAGEGVSEGMGEGVSEGMGEGVSEGAGEGASEGMSEGTSEGTGEGTSEGTGEGTSEGTGEGTSEGTGEGTSEGTGDSNSNPLPGCGVGKAGDPWSGRNAGNLFLMLAVAVGLQWARRSDAPTKRAVVR